MARGLGDEVLAGEGECARVFGDGSHPSTMAIATVLPGLLGEGRGRLLDAGSGTGTLSEIASRCGARVVAVDRDPAAAAATAARVPSALIICGDLRDALPSLGHFDIIVANLDERELASLAPALAAALVDGGTLLATGVPLSRTARITRCLEARSLHVEARAHLGWALLICK